MWLFEDKSLEYVEQTQLKLSVFAAKYALVKGNHTLIEQIVNVWVRPSAPAAAALELDAAAPPSSESSAPSASAAAAAAANAEKAAPDTSNAEPAALEGEHKSLEYLLHLVDFSALFALNDTFRMHDLSERLRCASFHVNAFESSRPLNLSST
jgi:hypothetical protein